MNSFGDATKGDWQYLFNPQWVKTQIIATLRNLFKA